MDSNEIAVESKNAKQKHQHEKQWTNPTEFLMTCIGFSVGLGNVWRFPYLCFKNGGSAFVIAFLIILGLAGLPLFYLELTLAQFSKFGPLDVWKVVPAFRGIGICSLLIAATISIYYNLIICWSLIYVISSFVPTLPWTQCSFSWNDMNCCVPSINSTDGIRCANYSESPAKQYFEKYVLDKSSDIGDIGGINWKLALSLLSCWLLVFLSLSKGVQSLGKVSYVTAIFPYIMIFALIVRGVTLPGAMKGIEFYILKINTEKLFTIQTWIDAINQVYFCLSIGQAGLYTLGRHNTFHYNHERTSVFVTILDGLTGVIAGLAIFSVLGYMSELTGKPVQDLAVGGPGLSFIVYPEALSLMPFPWIWCIFFFLMMVTIGFGSILSYMECVLDSLTEVLKRFVQMNKKRETLFRFCMCIVFFLFGLTMSTRSGIYIQNLLDNYVSGYPVLICAALEAIAIGWIYGIPRLKHDLFLMRGAHPNIYWIVCYLVITPVVAIIGFILAIVDNAEVKLNNYRYPFWAHIIGWIIVGIVLSPLFICFELSLSKYNCTRMFKPAASWQPAMPKEINIRASELSMIRKSIEVINQSFVVDDDDTDETDSRSRNVTKF